MNPIEPSRLLSFNMPMPKKDVKSGSEKVEVEDNNFIGFSPEDERLADFLSQGVDLSQKSTNDPALLESFKTYSSSHPIYKTVNGLTHSSGETFSANYLFKELIGFSRKRQTTMTEPKMVWWPCPITEFHLTGSSAWYCVMQHPDILADLIQTAFGQFLSKESLAKWVVEMQEDFSANQKNRGTEVNCKFVSPQATLIHLKAFSHLAREKFVEKFPELAEQKVGITKFSVINENMTLIGFHYKEMINKVEKEIHREYTFTTDEIPLPLSNLCALSICITNKGVKVKFLGFNPAAVLMSSRALGGVYVFWNENFQSYFRYLYNSQCLCVGDSEKQIVEKNLEVFCKTFPHDLKTTQERYIEMMDSLGFGFNQPIIKYWNKGQFCSEKQEMIERYIHFRIARHLETKIEHGICLHPELAAPFALRVLFSLYNLNKLSDPAIQQITEWLCKDNLLIYSETPPLAKLLVELIKAKATPVSVIRAYVTLLAMIYQPDTFTKRQSEPLFFVKDPFILHIPADIEISLNIIKNYVRVGENLDALKQIHDLFSTSSKERAPFHQKICEELKLDLSSVQSFTDILLHHADPFMVALGTQLNACVTNPIQSFVWHRQLPPLIELKCEKSLKILQRGFENQHGKIQPHSFNRDVLVDWIQLLIQTNQPPLLSQAYLLWTQNGKMQVENFALQFIKYFTFTSPSRAIHIFLENYSEIPVEEAFCLETFNKIQQQFSSNLIDVERFSALLHAVIMDPHLDFHSINADGKFTQLILKTLQELPEQKKQQKLLMQAILKNYLEIRTLPKDFQRLIEPFTEFLTYRQKRSHALSLPEKKVILSFFNTSAHSTTSLKIKQAWIILLYGVFYPNANTLLSEAALLKLLKFINQYTQKSDNLEELEELYEMMHLKLSFDDRELVDRPLKNLNLIHQELDKFDQSNHSILQTASSKIRKNLLDIPSLSHLPKLLKNPSKNLHTLEGLTKEFFPDVNIEEFNIARTKDWINLLLKTKDSQLIELAYVIWKENTSKCENGTDLLVFIALSQVEPATTLHHFCQLHAQREPALTAADYLTCLNTLTEVYRNSPFKNHLKILLPIVEELVQRQDFWKPTEKNQLSNAILLINKCSETSENTYEFLLKALLEGFISLEHLEETHLSKVSHSLSQRLQEDKPHRAHLQKLCIDIGAYLLEQKDAHYTLFLDHLLNSDEILKPVRKSFAQFFSKAMHKTMENEDLFIKQFLAKFKKFTKLCPEFPGNAKLVNSFFTQLVTLSSSSISLKDLNGMDSLLVEYQQVLSQLPNWSTLILSYLGTTEISSKRSQLNKLIEILMDTNVEATSDSLRILAKLLECSPKPPLVARIKEYIKASHPIDLFIENKEFHIAQIYMKNSSLLGLSTQELSSHIWQVCEHLVKDENNHSKILMDLLNLKSLKEWNTFFQKHYSFEENSLGLEEKLNSFKALFQCFFHEKNKTFRKTALGKWGSCLLENYFRLSNHSSLQSFFNCSDEEYIEVLPLLLTSNTSAQVKEELFYARPLSGKKIEAIIDQEIQQQVSSPKIYFSACLKLIRHYFPNDLNRFFPLIAQSQASDDIAEVILVLENYKGIISSELANCWLQIIDILIKQKAPDLEIQEKTLFLITKLKQSNRVSYEVLLNTFNRLQQKFISIYPHECLMLLGKIFETCEKTSSVSIDETQLSQFHANLALLKKHLCENFNSAILSDQAAPTQIIEDAAISYSNLCDLLSDGKSSAANASSSIVTARDALLLYLKNRPACLKLNTYCQYDRQLALQLMEQDYDATVQSYSVVLFQSFFENYPIFIKQLGFKPEQKKKLYQYAIAHLMSALANNSKAEQANKQIDQAISTLLASVFTNSDADYVKTLCEIACQTSYSLEIQKNLIETLMARVVDKMQIAKKQNKKPLFDKAKKQFENAIDYVMFQATPLQMSNEKFEGLFKKIQSLNLYSRKDEWLLVRLEIINLNKEIDGRSRNELMNNLRFHIQAVYKLLSYPTLENTEKAVRMYIQYLYFRVDIELNEAQALFETVSTAAAQYPLEMIEDQTFLGYFTGIYKQFKASNDNKMRLKKEERFKPFLIHTFKFQYQLILTIAEKVKDSGAVNSDIIAYYTMQALFVLKQLLSLGAYEEVISSYEQDVQLLLPLVKQVLHIYSSGEMTHAQPFSVPSLEKFVEKFNKTFLELSTENSLIQLKRITVLINFLKELSEDAKRSVISREIVKFTLFELCLRLQQKYPTLTGSITKKFYSEIFLSIKPDFLLPSDEISFNICRMHFLKINKQIDDNKIYSELDTCSQQLVNVPRDVIYWQTLYKILQSYLKLLPATNILAKLAAYKFLRLHNHYLEGFETDALEKFSLEISNLMGELMLVGRIHFQDGAFQTVLSGLKGNFEKLKIEPIPLEMLALLSEASQLGPEPYKYQIEGLMLSFAKWLVEKDLYEGSCPRFFTCLFQRFPEFEAELEDFWNLAILMQQK